MMEQLSTSPIMGLAFGAMFALSGCNNVQPVTADPAHNTQETVTSPHAGRQMTQCPPFNPEMNMCTCNMTQCVSKKNKLTAPLFIAPLAIHVQHVANLKRLSIMKASVSKSTTSKSKFSLNAKKSPYHWIRAFLYCK